MAKETKEKDQKKVTGQSSGQAVVSAISAAVEKGFASGLKPYFDAQEKTNKALLEAVGNISASQEELIKGLHELALGNLEAAGEADVEEVQADATDATMAAKKGRDSTDPTGDPTEDDSTGNGDATDATDDDATVQADATASDVDPTNFSDPDQDSGAGSDKSDPGNMNEDATARAKSNARQGSTEMTPGGASKSPGIAASARRGTSVAQISAAAKVIRSMQAERAQLLSENKKLRNRVTAMEASIERYAERVERKSVTPEIQALLEKSGYDVREMMSSRQKLAVSEVDTLLANSGVGLEPSMRAAFKNQLLQLGLMDSGEVRRYQ
jgi:regulator of replication initiation timing